MRFVPVVASWVQVVFLLNPGLALQSASAQSVRPTALPWVQVKGQAQVAYPTPSATEITDVSARLTGFITPGSQGATLSLDLGTAPGEMVPDVVQQTLAPSSADVTVTIASAHLVQGTAYRWRYRLVTPEGNTVEGQEQTFTTLPGDVSLSFASSPGGEAEANPVRATYPAGAQVRVTALPFGGYRFVGWKLDGASAGTDNPLVLTLNHSSVVTPQFEAVVADAGLAPAHVNPSGGCSTGMGPLPWLALLGVLGVPGFRRRPAAVRADGRP